MAKEFVGKALAGLSKSTNPDGANLCDRIASILTDMTSGDVKALNSALDFGWLKYQMRDVSLPGGVSREDVANRRRAAQLLKRVFTQVSIPKDQDHSESWDEGKLRTFTRLYTSQATRVTGSGFYLKGSFWAFSCHDERVWTKAAWAEGLKMLDAGIAAARAAAAPGKARNVLARWFDPADHAEVLQKLEGTRTTIGTKRIGICYHGTGAAQNPCQYQEEGQETNKKSVGLLTGEWGYASPQACSHNNIGFGPKFFDHGQTRVSISRPHDTSRHEGLDVTRGGAIVHELTHRYAMTNDEIVPSATYIHLGKTAPAKLTVKGYGPYNCHALGQSAGATALKNADSYRLFCEEALLLT